MTKFHRFRVWPAEPTAHRDDGVWAHGRTPQEAADEAFLDFISLEDPPASIALNCQIDHGLIGLGRTVRVTVYPSFQTPFVTREPERVLPW